MLVLDTLLALPSVVVGLAVYLLLSRSGPLGSWGILFTPTAMVIAQTILVLPIVTALARQVVADALRDGGDQLRSMGAGALLRGAADAVHERWAVATVMLVAFGRAIAEVGAVMIVGGNIDGVTRVMTTTIALETSKGDLPLALALGLVLLVVVALLNVAIALWPARQRRRWRPSCDDDAPASTLIVLREASVAYGAVQAVRDATMRVTRGDFIAVVGANGSGKTTLLRLLHGLVRAHRRRARCGDLRGVQAMVFQRPSCSACRSGTTCASHSGWRGVHRGRALRERARERRCAVSAWAPCATGRRARCRAASSSASRSRAPGRCGPTSCSSTSPPPASTRRRRRKWRRCSPTSPPTA